ncbi:MAG: hypothetical protein QXP20_03340 [Candidatus Bathyarchaeia archaeon]
MKFIPVRAVIIEAPPTICEGKPINEVIKDTMTKVSRHLLSNVLPINSGTV